MASIGLELYFFAERLRWRDAAKKAKYVAYPAAMIRRQWDRNGSMDISGRVEDGQRIQLLYRGGTLLVEGMSHGDLVELSAHVRWDERTLQYRAPGYRYREIFSYFHRQKRLVVDEARGYGPLDFDAVIEPRPHQRDALAAWKTAGQRGTVVLPTGAGKTILAMMALSVVKRSTIVIVPTIDLLHQWVDVIQRFYQGPVGLLGGGQHDLQALTVATYDSAAIYSEKLGDKFGLLICDECHHLPAPQYQLIALASIAPYRLGLSATVERPDGKESVIYSLLGPLVFTGRIREMTHETLSPYEVVTLEVSMTDDELAAYEAARSTYTKFLRAQGIRMNQRDGWLDFIKKSSRSSEGKKAMKAYWLQKRLAQAASEKIRQTWLILRKHRGQRILIFTDDNQMAYRIGRQFFVPVLTHKTKLSERKLLLEEFRQGKQSIIATSKVLNEGVDVPEASIGIVLSGSGAVREHVQRLGRILRHQDGKKAILYELVAKGTGEHYVNRRRKQHDAYEGPSTRSTSWQ